MTSPTYRYGLFLRPPAAISRIQAEIHTLLRRQFGLIASGSFPPHMTILGHVATRDDDQEVIDAAIEAMREFGPVQLYNSGLAEHSGGIVHDVGRLADGEANPALLELFRAARRHLDPLRVELGSEFKGGVRTEERFYGHMTLAGHDLAARPELFDEVFTFLSTLNVDARGDYIADRVALFRFETTSGWDNRWWEGMTWKLLRSITLE